MTLMDLLRIMRKSWILLVALTLAGGLLGGAYVFLTKADDAYTAKANVVGNTQVGGVVGYAKAEARSLIGDDEDAEYKYSVGGESGSQTAVITVTGPDEEECIRLANEIAYVALKEAKASFTDWENPYYGYVDKATKAEVKKSSGGGKFVIVGLLAGLFIGICIVVIIDMVRRPIKSVEGMQDLVELPVLEKLPAKDGNRLLANIRFASKKDDLKTVCVVPLGEGSLAMDICALLKEAIAVEAGKGIENDVFEATACDPLSLSMDGAYSAREADAVIVAGKQWDDSLTALESTVAELKLADSNIIGLVFALNK